MPLSDCLFAKTLADRPLLFDGAMGTELYQRGVFLNQSFEGVVLNRPELVEQVHRAYVDAGADVLETHTYGANRISLKDKGLAGEAEAINRGAVRLARAAAGDSTFVAGAMGPTGLDPRLADPQTEAELRLAYVEQAGWLLDEGVDLLVLETFTCLWEMGLVLSAVRGAFADAFILASCLFDADGRCGGAEPRTVGDRLVGLGANALGANCGEGPDVIFAAATALLDCGVPVAAMSNAGSPTLHEGRHIYVANPEFFAVHARRLLKAGVKMVGGCCGTTPAHTKRMASAFHMFAPRISSPAAATAPAAPHAPRSNLDASLRAGRFCVSAEVNPPKGLDPSKALAAARLLRAGGVDVINTSDGPRATARMDNVTFAGELAMGGEVIVHTCCRDLNVLGLQARLLGLHQRGLRNLVVITGDPPKSASRAATGVYDLDSIGLLNMARGLNEGVAFDGSSIGGKTDFFLLTGAEPAALDRDREIRRLEQKVAAGARAVMTQPVYDPVVLQRFLADIAHLQIKVLVGILPLASLRNAHFLDRNVPGMRVPEAVLERLAAQSPETVGEEGVRIAREALSAVAGTVHGAYIMPPLGRYERALAVLDGIDRGTDWVTLGAPRPEGQH
jgi:methionine synthase I (cobalamin-dependent)/5,10-methylenetetrahydrofolate reductase